MESSDQCSRPPNICRTYSTESEVAINISTPIVIEPDLPSSENENGNVL